MVAAEASLPAEMPLTRQAVEALAGLLLDPAAPEATNWALRDGAQEERCLSRWCIRPGMGRPTSARRWR
jgi:hypothetical protein